MAVPPYNDNRNLPSAGTAQLRPGRVTDRSRTGGSAPTGVPSQPMVQYTLNSPTAADDNWFVASTTTGTTSKTYTLLSTAMPDTYAGSGGDSIVTFYVARNVTGTLSGGSATSAAVITGTDFQGQAQTETLNWTAETGLKSGVKAFATITSIISTSDTSRTIIFGTGNVFGLPYPMYSNQGICGVLYDADGADYAATPLVSGGTATGAATSINSLALDGFKNANGITPVGSAAAGNLGLVTGTAGTATPSLQSIDVQQTTGTPTARWIQFVLPSNYAPGSAITVRINGGVITNVLFVSATVDVAVYKNGAGSDLSTTTAATTINSASAVTVNFVITPTGLVAGDWLDILMTVALSDSGGAAAAKVAKINSVSVITTAAANTVAGYYTFTPGDPTSTTADRYGTVLLGTDNTTSGTLVPDGTADYAIWFLCNDTEGVLNSGGTGPIYDIT